LCLSAGGGDGKADEKMDDEICGSLKLMRRANGEERGSRWRVKSLFLCLLLLIKERDYTLWSVFIHSVRGKETENKTLKESETVRYVGF